MPTKRQMLLGLTAGAAGAAAGAAGARIPLGGLGGMLSPADLNGAEGVYHDSPDAERISGARNGELADRIVTIPTDFATLQDAVDVLSIRPHRGGVTITLNIETGHALTAGLQVQNGDYSRFTITSDDAEVLLDAAFPTTDPVLHGINCRMPNWNILVNCNDQTVGSAVEPTAVPAAILVDRNSQLLIAEGAGARNVGGTGLFVYRGSRVGGGPILSGCTGHALWVSGQSDAALVYADFSDSAHVDAAVYISRTSRLLTVGSSFNGAAGDGIRVRRSYAMIIEGGGTPSTFDGCGGWAIGAYQGSTVISHARSGVGTIITNCEHGIDCNEGSLVDFRGGAMSAITNTGMRAQQASKIIATNASALTVGGDVLVATAGSIIEATDLVAPAPGGRGITAGMASIVNAQGVDFSGCMGSPAVESYNGAVVNVSNADISNASDTALHALQGGKIIAHGATVSGAGVYGALAETGSEIVVSGADLSGAGSHGIFASDSRVSAQIANAQAGASASANDVVAQNGSIISFQGGTGGTSIMVNTLTASGIIFQ